MESLWGKGLRPGLATLALIFGVGCGSHRELTEPSSTAAGSGPVTLDDPAVETTVGDSRVSYMVLGPEAMRRRVMAAEAEDGMALLAPTQTAVARLGALSPSSALPENLARARTRMTDDEPSLTVGFPAEALGKAHVFGGVVTAVSDHDNLAYGMLKLADLEPLHVKPMIGKHSDGTYSLVLVGCPSKCTESSEAENLVAFPITAIEEEKKQVLVDLDAVGKGLNLLALTPEGQSAKLAAVSSQTTFVDYSDQTLVFDVQTVLAPADEKGEPVTGEQRRVTFTARWYLKDIAPSVAASFQTRQPTEGVGFFTTERSLEPLIMRWPLASDGAPKPITYYLKNIPASVRPDFAAAFEEWNKLFEADFGRPIFHYEFLETTDPRFAKVVTGDVRYNVVEWDLANKAPYGGLGPSIASQETGQIFSANVLVQGPTIEETYRGWFNAFSSDTDGPTDRGPDHAGIFSHPAARGNVKIDLGRSLGFRVPAAMPEYQDESPRRFDFEKVPSGYTYDSYMKGYWQELLAHELGHNLGLRHNFRGNLGARRDLGDGGVSSSIMEYLGRTHRQHNRIGAYDLMAIRFGYRGDQPAHRDWYCTDEDVVSADEPTNSADCSRDDLTADPYGNWRDRLRHALELLVVPGSPDAPSWTLEEMKEDIAPILDGLLAYVSSAEKSSAQWTHWQVAGENRPSSPQGIPMFVTDDLRGIICNEDYTLALGSKINEAARAKAADNLGGLQKKLGERAEAFKLDPKEFKCQ